MEACFQPQRSIQRFTNHSGWEQRRLSPRLESSGNRLHACSKPASSVLRSTAFTRPVAERFPDVRWVFAHWGGGLPFYALMPEVKEALANVYFDSAVSPFLYDARVFDVAARVLGAGQILFGSDFPLLPASRVMEQARSMLDIPTAQAVLGGNAARLLGLADD